MSGINEFHHKLLVIVTKSKYLQVKMKIVQKSWLDLLFRIHPSMAGRLEPILAASGEGGVLPGLDISPSQGT